MLTSAAFAATGARRPKAAGARRSFWNSFIGPHTKRGAPIKGMKRNPIRRPEWRISRGHAARYQMQRHWTAALTSWDPANKKPRRLPGLIEVFEDGV
jgi:hypothetical protein